MAISPVLRQLLVAGSSQLAALSVGGAVSYPGVLLQQLATADSVIRLDLDTASWIGSIFGLAGIPSILMPAVMQRCGHRFAFIMACLLSVIGWIFALTANNIIYILISESFHGLGSNSLFAVSLLSISEMVAPRFRSVSMVSFTMIQALGMVLTCIIGRYLHWKTVSFIMIVPVTVAMLTGVLWPESPLWLASKGEFAKCEKVFLYLRGTDELSKKELQELMTAQKETLINVKKNRFLNIWQTLITKDFYTPMLHIFVLLNLAYGNGSLVILIYSIEMIQNTTHNIDAAFYGGIIMNSILFICVTISVILIRRFNHKPVLLFSTFVTTVCLLCTALLNYLQNIDVLSKDSLICLYLLIVHMISACLAGPIVCTVAAELIPVKHRGTGGSLYVIITCILHTSSLKLAPYMFLYINVYGALLIYALNAMLCGLFVWACIPETKDKTLQQLEDYYMYGRFDERSRRSDKDSVIENLTFEMNDL